MRCVIVTPKCLSTFTYTHTDRHGGDQGSILTNVPQDVEQDDRRGLLWRLSQNADCTCGPGLSTLIATVKNYLCF